MGKLCLVYDGKAYEILAEVIAEIEKTQLEFELVDGSIEEEFYDHVNHIQGCDYVLGLYPRSNVVSWFMGYAWGNHKLLVAYGGIEESLRPSLLINTEADSDKLVEALIDLKVIDSVELKNIDYSTRIYTLMEKWKTT